MKRLKKLLAVLVTMITVIAMAVPVSVSADDTTYSVTITANDSGTHTYSAYQIFSGTVSEDGSTLSDIDWGTGVKNTTSLITALKNDATIGSDMADVSTAADVAAVLVSYGDDSDKLKAFAAVINPTYLADTATKVVEGSGNVDINGLSAGYYLITDSLAVGSEGAESATILEVVGNVKITSKSNLPTVTKEAKIETASIGDTIPYTITGTLSTTFADYLSGGSLSSSPYFYTLTDTMADCLDLVGTVNSSTGAVSTGVTVKMDGTSEVTSSFTITYSNHVLTLTCTDISAISNITASSIFTITYSATVNDSLTNGNIVNTVKLETTEATTPDIKETVYTFELDITKEDGDTKAVLEDATFVLKNSSSKYLFIDTTNSTYNWVDNEDDASTFTTDDDGKIAISGLAAGTYYLEETVAPDGYNLLEDDLKIVIEANINQSTGELTSYTITVDDGTAATGADDTNGNHVLSITVENNQGATLPSTGGIGTTLLYVCGSILALVIVVLLITKIRMKAED